MREWGLGARSGPRPAGLRWSSVLPEGGGPSAARAREPTQRPVASRQLARALIHDTILPTALAAHGDHYYILGAGRYMTVKEVCRSMGLSDDSPLMRAMLRVPCPTTAITMAGRGVHAAVARRVVDKLSQDGLLPHEHRILSPL